LSSLPYQPLLRFFSSINIAHPKMSLSTPFQIVIVGGGIAGMAAAIALRRPGRRITILEQSRLITEIGATISLQPNATRILQHSWGLSDVLESAAGMVDCSFRIYNTDGRKVNEIPLPNHDKYGADRIMWHRQDLHMYLKSKATTKDGPGAPAILRASSRVIECDPRAGLITLEDGEKLGADLIIGADGIHSSLRSVVLGKKVTAKPTGISAYRFMLPSSVLKEQASEFYDHISPHDPCTSMIMAHDCRLIMGPARGGDLYSVVGLVPDERMNEDPDTAQSWVNAGDPEKMLATFDEFPPWTKDMLKLANEVGLWQLRDLDPLETWTRGRVILIGDAAHAMLPTQGQGASQAVEDAEALGAYFSNVTGTPSAERVTTILDQVFQCRYARASLIQRYSRESAKPATEKGNNQIKMRIDEFMDHNCSYQGARQWEKQQLAAALDKMQINEEHSERAQDQTLQPIPG
jgi:salicylate hydroxylase